MRGRTIYSTTIKVAAVFFRVCKGCGRNVPLAEWQEGELGCDDCRARAALAERPPRRPASSPRWRINRDG